MPDIPREIGGNRPTPDPARPLSNTAAAPNVRHEATPPTGSAHEQAASSMAIGCPLAFLNCRDIDAIARRRLIWCES